MMMKFFDFLRTLHRCLYIQATWNFKGLMNLGFAQAMAPAICRLFPDPEKRARCLRRHLNFFLSNPYFAGYAVGACIRLEEQSAAAADPSPERIEAFKRAIGSPLASLGDNLIWGALRPASLLLGTALALVGSLWGPVLFLLGYNLPAVAVRAMGLKRGYALGFNIVGEISSPWFRRITEKLRFLAAVGLGLVAAVVINSGIEAGSVYALWALPTLGVIVLGRFLRISYYLVLVQLLAVFILLGYL
ncbi:PTS system mannose/fructose/sorbose family transporter subunit IID [candidate division KSB1 bacterium]